MPAKGIEDVLSQAMNDPVFADLLLADMDQALAGFDLTPEEITTLKAMSRTDFDAASTLAPEERRSFSASTGMATGRRTHKPIKFIK